MDKAVHDLMNDTREAVQEPPVLLNEEDFCPLLPIPNDLTSTGRQFDTEWKRLMNKGRDYNLCSKTEDAYKVYEEALRLCESSGPPNQNHYRELVQFELGYTYRRFGRHEMAMKCLEAALKDMGSCEHYIEVTGELGVVYRYLNRIGDAKAMFEAQYEKATLLKFEREICRSVGNLAIVNYELALRSLDTAIEQLNERVERAKSLRATIGPEAGDEMRMAKNLECIGHGRLSLCHAAKGDIKLAIDAGKKAVETAEEVIGGNVTKSKDPTVVASARLFYGRALLSGGQRREAMEQFDRDNECTAAISLCKEPSELHRQFLRQLVEAGASMSLVDEHNYSALDYAVFNHDERSQEIVMDGLKQTYGTSKVQQLRYEAQLRRGYRKLFQETLRPVLIHSQSEPKCFRKMRLVYSEALAADKWTRNEFDNFKFMRYQDFVRFGCLQTYSEDSARLLVNSNDKDTESAFVIFFSYRWIESSSQLPDNTANTQYRRMVKAIEQLLEQHQEVDRANVGIWVDYSCINQKDSSSGVHALPMILAQCNAVISLVDDTFYTRAWCSLETLLIQRLKQSYGVHQWYEQVPLNGEGGCEGWELRIASVDNRINIREKNLTMIEDWPKVLFLEKQAMLL
ncbi:hypothetical protein ACHAP8_012317 [Fusarium lateritium]